MVRQAPENAHRTRTLQFCRQQGTKNTHNQPQRTTTTTPAVASAAEASCSTCCRLPHAMRSRNRNDATRTRARTLLLANQEQTNGVWDANLNFTSIPDNIFFMNSTRPQLCGDVVSVLRFIVCWRVCLCLCSLP